MISTFQPGSSLIMKETVKQQENLKQKEMQQACVTGNWDSKMQQNPFKIPWATFSCRRLIRSRNKEQLMTTPWSLQPPNLVIFWLSLRDLFQYNLSHQHRLFVGDSTVFPHSFYNMASGQHYTFLFCVIWRNLAREAGGWFNAQRCCLRKGESRTDSGQKDTRETNMWTFSAVFSLLLFV